MVVLASLASFTDRGPAAALRSATAQPASPPVRLAEMTPADPRQILPLTLVDAKTINDARPAFGAIEYAPALHFAGSLTARERAVECLAAAAYYEAGDDPVGQRAVVQVVLNRVRHPSYPKSVCGVVFQGSERTTGCQFTFTCDGALARTPRPAAWTRARAVSSLALNGAVDVSVGAATHYHADYVVPKWSASLVKLNKVGAHIFYRFPGNWGRTSVFRRTLDPSERPVEALQRLSLVPAKEAAPDNTSLSAPDVASVTITALARPAESDTAPHGGPAQSQAIMLVPETGSPAGRWAVEAMRRCEGRGDCQVFGWRSAEQLERNRARAGQSGDRPVFLFIRDKASGMNVALWDCGVVLRAQVSECLPTDAAALQRLMRKRG